jgi:hypothetical protein
MFEHLFSHPSTVARHRATPYAAERERYLTSCAQQGYAHTTLRLKARELLWIARKLRVYPDLHVTPAQLEAVASGWHDRQQCCGRTLAERLRSGASVLASRLQRIVGHSSLRIAICAHEMQGHIGTITNHPAIVRDRRDIEEITSLHFDDRTVIERGCSRAGQDHSDVLHRTANRTNSGTDMLAPLPSWLIGRSSNGHAA